MIFIVILALIGLLIYSSIGKKKSKSMTKSYETPKNQFAVEEIKRTLDPSLNNTNIFAYNMDYANTEVDDTLNKIIDNEFKTKAYSEKAVCSEISKRRLIVSLIFSAINIYCLWLIYFQRMEFWSVVIWIISLIAYIKFIRNFKIKDVIKKQIQNRPDEEIENVIASIMFSSKNQVFDVKIFAVIAIPLVIWAYYFAQPHFFFENYNDGKSLRWYSTGWKNNPEIIEVPAIVDGKKVIRVRGDIFKDVTSVKKIIFNQGLEELRGKSFVGCEKLEEVTLPSSLVYLGGESFVDCYNLKYVNLGDTKITEIKGETFKGCRLLDNVVIPNTVNRIGGHAFEDCMSISKIDIPKSVQEIGSSAFRRCILLKKATIYTGTNVNERAFKESPTKIEWIK